jgi:uncharacterized damage-inducible protein DinB
MEQTSPAHDPRYPIGKFERPAAVTPEDRSWFIEDIHALPSNLRSALAGLSDSQLETPYREGGWTVRQVVHHLADSHMNSFVRFKLALTESNPTIKPYDEAAWAETADARNVPIEASLALLEGLHERWVVLLRAAADSDFERTFQHPERGSMTLDVNLALYSWHGRHHVAHVTQLRSRMGW